MRAGVASQRIILKPTNGMTLLPLGAKIDELPIATSHNGERDNSDQLWYRDQVAKHMTSEQIAEAQRLAREWKPEQ
jgi:hypothetical protein